MCRNCKLSGAKSERFFYESEEEGFHIGWDVGDIFDICMEFDIVLYWGI